MRNVVKLVLIALAGSALFAAAPIRVMLLDGESGGPYHQWQLVSQVLKKELDETGMFQVDVVTAQPAGGDFASFKPDFAKYQVVVWNYDAPDERWPAELKASFELGGYGSHMLKRSMMYRGWGSGDYAPGKMMQDTSETTPAAN